MRVVPGAPGAVAERPAVLTTSAGGGVVPDAAAVSFCARGTGGGSSFMQAFSSMLVHLPLVPWWLCLRCWRKWSARKNFLDWLHSPNLCTWLRWSARTSHCGGLANSFPQYPHASA